MAYTAQTLVSDYLQSKGGHLYFQGVLCITVGYKCILYMNAHESKYTLVVHPKELGSYAEHLQHFCFNPGLSPKRDLQNYQEDCRKSVFLDVGMKSYLY